MCYPKLCKECIKKGTNSDLFNGDLELCVWPYQGSDPKVMFIGQDPTIAKGYKDTVLDLYNKKGTLYKYIVGDILNPINLSIDNVYATNIIKCRFPNNQTPSSVAKQHKILLTTFLRPFFNDCSKWLYDELVNFRPKLIITFGEPTHQMFLEEFKKFIYKISMQMKDAFGEVYKINLLDFTCYYCPCIHINTRGKSHYEALWGEFINNLKKLVSSAEFA